MKRPALNLKIFIVFAAIGILAGIVVFTYPNASPSPAEPEQPPTESQNEQPQTIKASFTIYTNGTMREFKDPKYHHKSGDIYIDASAPHSIRIKEAGRAWSDFFNTLPMQLTATCLTTGTGQSFCTNTTHSLKFFVNGKNMPDALENEIIAGDKLLVSYGPKNDPAVTSQLSKVPEP